MIRYDNKMFFKRIKNVVEFLFEKYFLLIVLIVFLFIVNSLTFSGDMIFLNFNNAISFSPIFDNNKLKTYLSLIPILTLFVAYIQWYSNFRLQRISDINGLLEELRHNINLCKRYYENVDRPFYFEIYKSLNKLGINKEYPTHINQLPSITNFVKKIEQAPPEPYVNLRNDFVSSAISSKSYFHIQKHRIFINLGHLNYSIHRHNCNLERFLKNDIKFDKLQEEYLDWLHLRLHFMLVDLICNVNELWFIDRNFVNKIKGYFNEN